MTAGDLKAKGTAAFKAKDYKGAVAVFTKAIAEDGKDHTLFANRSAANLKIHEVAAAVQDGLTATKLKPDWPKGYARTGAAQFAANDFATAVKTYTAGLKLDAKDKAMTSGLKAAKAAWEHQLDEEAKEKKKQEDLRVHNEELKEEGAATRVTDDHVIGIDLGTTNSCVSVWEGEGVRVIPNSHGERTIPSYVSFDGAARHVGMAAKNATTRNPLNTIYDIKRVIGQRFSDQGVEQDLRRFPFTTKRTKDDAIEVTVQTDKGSQVFKPEEISAMILARCKQVAETYLGSSVSKAVITVPAYFNDAQRTATKAAGAIAGLEVLRIINEPTAAALAYGLDSKAAKKGSKAQKVLVFDLGGGTFDVSILNIEGGVFTVMATGGDTRLGGEDFDNTVVDYFISLFDKQGLKDPREDPRQMHRLRKAAELAKRNLSNAQKTEVRIDDLQAGKNFKYVLYREKFEQLNKTKFNMTLETVVKVMKDAKVKTGDIEEIVLVGGSTRIPRVQEMLAKHFGKTAMDLCKTVNPDEAVAYGAAVQGAILNGQRNTKTDDILLMDVTPLSLGIETTGRVMSVVIPRNTAIPCKKTQVYTTDANYQTEVDISVYEGERLKSDENNLLGEFTITGIEQAKRGEPQIDVTFSLDSNGILKVTAKDQKTGAEANISITNRSQASDVDIKKMVADAEAFRKEDEVRVKKIEERNELENVINQTLEVAAEAEPKIAKILEDAANKTNQWLDENYENTTPGNIALKRSALERRIAGKV
jgi:heat shock protein 1/8